MSKRNWITLMGPARTNTVAGGVVPGDRLRLSDGTELLVGHVNAAGGWCDDCVGDEEVVAVERPAERWVSVTECGEDCTRRFVWIEATRSDAEKYLRHLPGPHQDGENL